MVDDEFKYGEEDFGVTDIMVPVHIQNCVQWAIQNDPLGGTSEFVTEAQHSFWEKLSYQFNEKFYIPVQMIVQIVAVNGLDINGQLLDCSLAIQMV